MVNRYSNTMISRLKPTGQADGVVVANDGQGLITIDDSSQLNDKYVEGLCRDLPTPGGNTRGVLNYGVVVSEMTKANQQGMIYYIKYFKSIEHTCTHADVELTNVCALYQQ